MNEIHIGLKGAMSALFLKGLTQKANGASDINPVTAAVIERIYKDWAPPRR